MPRLESRPLDSGGVIFHQQSNICPSLLLTNRKKMTSNRNVAYCASCGYLSALSFGYVIGYSAPSLPQMTEPGEIMNGDKEAPSWFGSIAMLGAMFGCLLTAWMADKYGRRFSLLAICAPFICGWLSIALGNEIWQLHLGRFLTGFGTGASSVAAPLYLAETVPKELRGLFGAGVQLSVTVGILLAYSLGIFLSWRSSAVIGAIIPLVAFVTTLQAPESPHYLLNSHRKDESIAVLIWLRGASAIAETEYHIMEKSQAESSDQATLSELFSSSELLRPLCVVLGVMIFQQATGINAVMFYSVSIFQAAGYADYGGLATIILGVIQVVMTAVACSQMDNRGRRQLLIIAGLGMALSCALLGVYYRISSASTHYGSSIGWLALASLIAYVAAFSLGWGPVPMLLTSEIFPSRARGLAASIATLFSWILGFLVTRYFALMNTTFGLDGSFWIFSCACFIAVAFVIRFVPETKGRSLEEIESFFSTRDTARI